MLIIYLHSIAFFKSKYVEFDLCSTSCEKNFRFHILSFTNLLINLNSICRITNKRASICNFVHDYFYFIKSTLYDKI